MSVVGRAPNCGLDVYRSGLRKIERGLSSEANEASSGADSASLTRWQTMHFGLKGKGQSSRGGVLSILPLVAIVTQARTSFETHVCAVRTRGGKLALVAT